MQGNRSTDTKLEVRFREAIWAAGLRGYRKNDRRFPGTPDVVFVRKKVAVFLQGCFWHGCTKCTRNLRPKTNALYWSTKIEQNRERDQRNLVALEEMGYTVLVFWECELKGEGLAKTVATIKLQIADSGQV